MSERPRVLEQLGDELERVAGTVLRDAGGSRGLARRPARRLSVLAVCLLLLVLAAAAAAAVLLVQEGSPLPAPHAQDLRASGIPLPASAHLAGLDAPDPDSSSPPWDLRLSRTSGGETCTAVGQVYDGQFGIVGLDRVFRALPLGSVDSCGIDSGAKDEPLLVGAKSFVGATPGQARTVISGIVGQEARSVTVAVAGGAPRRLRLGPQGSFITVYAGEAETLQPRVMIALRDGRMRTVELERSGAFEVPDPEGGGAWAASSEPDLEANAFADEDCVQVTRQASQSEPSHVTLALTPEICGRLGASPLFVQIRRFVPGETSTPRFPWGNTPSRTVVYGVAAPRVQRLTLSGAGATRSLQIDPRGGAFVAVLDGHVDPRSLTLTATLRTGAHVAYRHPAGLLAYQTNKPIPAQPVPAYRTPLPVKSTLPPPFEFPIAATVTETLRSPDPADGPEWVLRSWQGKPNTHVNGVSGEQFLCIQLGVLYHGNLVEPTATPSANSLPLSSEGGRCNQAKDLNRMRYTLTLESFLDDPYQYTPHPARAILSGMLPPGASHPILLGAGPARPLPLDANNAFLVVLPGRYWDAHPRISYVLDGHRIGKLPGGPGPRLYRHGIETKIPQVRAPDPDGAAPWGLTATRDCTTAVGRIVAGKLASIDLSNGVLQAGSDFSGSSSSCATHPEAFTPVARKAELDKPVEFDEQQVGAGESPPQTQPHLRQPEIQWRTLPGRTILTGIARPDVTSITLSSPSDMRTLRPSGPLHTILAVYDGYFLRGNLTATIRLHNGHVQTERIASFGAAYYPPEPLNVQLREARQTLQQMHAHTRTHTAPHGLPTPLFEAHIHAIERRLAYEHAHPGLLPAG